MRGVLIRLANSDSEAAAALRIISYFDALVEHQNSDLRSVVRGTAVLAECSVGVEMSDGDVISFDPEGNTVSVPYPPAETNTTEAGHHVWLARTGSPEPTDALIMERMAIAVDFVHERRRRFRSWPTLGDPALVELILSDGEAAQDRLRATTAIGLHPDTRLRVVALATSDGSDPAAAAVALLARARPSTRSADIAVIGGVAAALVHDEASDGPLATEIRAALRARSSAGVNSNQLRCGVSGAAVPAGCPRAWAQAAAALKFTTVGLPEQAVISYNTLGPLALLAELPPELIQLQPDVAALDRLAQTPAGSQDVQALDVFCQTGSYRAAASALYLHHSSVASRLAHVEEALGLLLDTPEGRFRATMCTLVRHLA